jgi:hypothetical protein
MKKSIIAMTISIVMFSSCNNSIDVKTSSSMSRELDYQQKVKFGKALATALSKNLDLRVLLKEEAMKMFDKDYDVLYASVKDRMLQNGKTFREELSSSFNNLGELESIEKNQPLLTIFVPSLPEESFSAESWDVSTEVPMVAISSRMTNDVVAYDGMGKELLIKSNLIPAFPIVVIKDNERIRLTNNSTTNLSKTTSFRVDKSEYAFLSPEFDASYKPKTARSDARVLNINSIDQKVRDAYNIYRNVDGWQRDYIYYDISPSQPNGEFKVNFQERITDFRMIGDPTAAFNKLSDQTGDPTLQVSRNPNSGWTNGFYEFKVSALINGRNGVGQELVTYFPATPTELFSLTYSTTRIGWLTFYIPSVTGLNTKTLNLPIFSWDLNAYSTSIKIAIEEVDLTETIFISDTRQVEFATNFGIEGVLKKIGLKFGASNKEIQTQTITRTFTQGNDSLGEVIINFADNVIVSTLTINRPWPYGPTEVAVTREYATGWYSFSFEPIRVQ